MPSARPRNADLTGRTLTEQNKQHAQTLAERKDEIGLARAAEVAALETEVLDYSHGNNPTIVDVVEEPIEVSEEWRVIRTNEDLEDVTIGVGTNYTFRAGQKTKVSIDVANHLESLGYVWH